MKGGWHPVPPANAAKSVCMWMTLYFAEKNWSF